MSNPDASTSSASVSAPSSSGSMFGTMLKTAAVLGGLAGFGFGGYTLAKQQRKIQKLEEKESMQSFSIAKVSESLPTFRVMQWNILAHSLEHHHSYCLQEYRTYDYRCRKIITTIKRYAADIICIQEITPLSFEKDFNPIFSELGYAGRLAAKHEDKSRIAIAMFVNESVFLIIDTQTIQFADENIKFFSQYVPEGLKVNPNVSTKNALSNALGESTLLDTYRDLNTLSENAIITQLVHKSSNSVVVAVCTHIYWNPRHPHLKLMQTFYLTNAIERYLMGHNLSLDTPVVMCGDFNSLDVLYQPDAFNQNVPKDGLSSAVYELITKGKASRLHPHHPFTRDEAKQIPDLETTLKLASAYVTANGVEPALTTKTPSFAGTLDYCFHSPESLKVLSTLSTPFTSGPKNSVRVQEEIDAFAPMPNQFYPSDHLAIGADFMICDKNALLYTMTKK